MPLPDGGPWPPLNLARVTNRLETWVAWYSADPNDLAHVYGGYNGTRDRSSPFDQHGMLVNRSAQYRGGIVGRMAR